MDLNTYMKQDARQVFAKVDISYNDPTTDTSLATSATETGRFTYPSQIADELDAPDYKYFSLHNNKLDGTFHPLPGNVGQAQVGWWGDHLSDSSGNLDPNNSVQMLPDFNSWTRHVNATVDASNSYKLTLNATASFQQAYIQVPALPNTTYTMSITATGTGARMYVQEHNASGTFIQFAGGNASAGVFTRTFTTSSTTYFLQATVDNNTSTGTFTFTNPKLEKGSVATAFEPKITAPTPTITMTFNSRPVYTLKVTGDSILGEYPVNFVIKLYSGASVVYTETVTGNNSVYWFKDIADIGSITKVDLTISKINKPFTVPKIVECYTGVSESYDVDRIRDFTLLEEQVFDDMTLPIGNISSNEIDVTMDNTDKHFDPRNTLSPLYGQLKKNRRVKPYLGVDLLGDGNITWYPLGVFFTYEWKAPTNDNYATVTARDRMESLKQKEFTSSLVYQNYSLYQLADMVFQDFGLAAREYTIDTSLQSVYVPYAWFDRVTHREALAQIAEAGLARLYSDRNGKLKMEVQRTTAASVFEFKDDETIFSADYPFAGGQFVNYIETEARQRVVLPTVETVYSDTNTISVSGTSTQTYKFNFVPCVNVQAPVIVSSGVSVASYTTYAWGMVVTYTGSGSVSSVTISGQKLDVLGGSVALAQDTTSINENGKVTKTIGNDFIQTLDRAQAVSNTILASYKDPRNDIELDTRGHVTTQLGDKITAPGFDIGTTNDYYIIRQTTKWDGALSATIKGLKV